MSQLTIPDLEEELQLGLKQRAARHGCDVEEEARRILRAAIEAEQPVRTGLGSRIAAYFSADGLIEELPEMRGQRTHPARFER